MADHEHLTPSSGGGGAPTPALPGPLRAVTLWAQHHNCTEALQLVLDTCLINAEYAHWLGTPLHFLSAPFVAQHLERWRHDAYEIEALRQLSTALQLPDAADLLEQNQPLPSEVRARQQFHGTLGWSYTVAVLTTTPSAASPDEPLTNWFSTMQIWLLAHAAIRTARNSAPLDSNLAEVSSLLRKASQSDPRWLTFITHLCRPLPSDWLSINRHLVRRAEHLLPNYPRGVERDALRALLKTANLESSPPTSFPQHFRPFGAQSRESYVQPWSASASLDDDEENDSQVVALDTPTDPNQTSEPLASIAVDPNESPKRQLREARSILLLSREENQFLPNSWHRLSRAEHDALERWFSNVMNEPAATQARILATLVWLALKTHRSLDHALALRIDDAPGNDWTISPKVGGLIRLPPRPRNGWKPSANQARLVQPSASHHRIPIPEWISETVSQIIDRIPDSPKPVGTLWRADWPSPNAEFRNAARRHGFERAQPQMLGHLIPAALFKVHEDSVCAMMTTARPNSGLPGATAYASWNTAELAGIARKAGYPLEVIGSDGDNAQGSELAPEDSVLRALLARSLACTAEDGEHQSAHQAHNSYVSKLVLLLFAATGARPIRDPFESLAHFDLEGLNLFIADKLSPPLRRGRLVPIPQVLATHLRRDYLPYLERLAKHLQENRPTLSKMIASTVGPAPQMPLLFHLTPNLTDWRSISETTIQGSLPEPFSLPLNCFRHRIAQRLRRCDVEAELIDAQMGHVWAGTPTHGDHSLRAWGEDMNRLRPELESTFSALDPVLPKAPTRLPALGETLTSCLPQLFGIARREDERKARTRAAHRQAHGIIEDHLAGRQVDELDETELRSLERALVRTERGMPHPYGAERYQFYQRFLEHKRHHGTFAARRRRVYVALDEDDGTFTELAAQATALRSRLADLVEHVSRSHPPSRTSAADAELLCVLHLALESRISNIALLKALRCAETTRIAFQRGRYFIEFCPAPREDAADNPKDTWASTATIKLPISRRTAEYFAAASKPRKRGASEAICSELENVLPSAPGENEAGSVDTLIQDVADIVDQANIIELPGVVAGFLAGRVVSLSLDWNDVVRLDTGKVIEAADPDASSTEELAPFSGGEVAPSMQADRLLLQTSAKTFFDEIRSVLLESEAGRRTNARRDQAHKLREVIARHCGRVSGAIEALGHWTLELTQTVNRLASVRRYLSALSGAAEQMWYDLDLFSSDEEDLTDAYQALIEARPDRDLHYVGVRLRNFHRFARQKYGIGEPAWSELGLPGGSVLVSPGYIAEQDYLRALELMHSSEIATEIGTAGCAVLVLCYRFGLRAGEAFGLTRADWLEDGNETRLLVRNNRHRKLKRETSRRIVPLLFKLEPAERSALNAMLTRAAGDSGLDNDAPLLGRVCVDKALLRQVHHNIIHALRAATGNRNHTLHHARHTFATRVFVALLSPEQQHSQLIPDPVPDGLRAQLLGSNRNTRRLSWALARLLGHARIDTTFTSYVHVLDRLATGFMAPSVARRHSAPTVECFNVDSLPTAQLKHRQIEMITPLEPRPLDHLRLLRIVASGTPWETAAAHLNLEQSPCASLMSAVGTVAGGQEHMLIRDFLRSLTETQWGLLQDSFITLKNDADEADHAPACTGLFVGESAHLIGRHRQLLMAQERHFKAVRTFINLMKIPARHFDVTATDASHPQLGEMAKTHGFELIARDKLSQGKTKLQIDTLSLDGGFSTIRHRAALVFRENSDFTIRNRIGLALAFLMLSNTKPP